MWITCVEYLENMTRIPDKFQNNMMVRGEVEEEVMGRHYRCICLQIDPWSQFPTSFISWFTSNQSQRL